MATREVRENVLTWNALMSACRPGEEDEVEEAVRAAEWHQGLHCLALMGQRSLQLKTSSDQARDELKEMRPRPWRQVLALFHTFEEETFQPTRLAWGAVLGVLARQALWAGALGALNTLVSGFPSPKADEVHYDLLVSACDGQAPGSTTRRLLSNVRHELLMQHTPDRVTMLELPGMFGTTRGGGPRDCEGENHGMLDSGAAFTRRGGRGGAESTCFGEAP
eukprot:g3986.t1